MFANFLAANIYIRFARMLGTIMLFVYHSFAVCVYIYIYILLTARLVTITCSFPTYLCFNVLVVIFGIFIILLIYVIYTFVKKVITKEQ